MSFENEGAVPVGAEAEIDVPNYLNLIATRDFLKKAGVYTYLCLNDAHEIFEINYNTDSGLLSVVMIKADGTSEKLTFTAEENRIVYAFEAFHSLEVTIQNINLSGNRETAVLGRIIGRHGMHFLGAHLRQAASTQDTANHPLIRAYNFMLRLHSQLPIFTHREDQWQTLLEKAQVGLVEFISISSESDNLRFRVREDDKSHDTEYCFNNPSEDHRVVYATQQAIEAYNRPVQVVSVSPDATRKDTHTKLTTTSLHIWDLPVDEEF